MTLAHHLAKPAECRNFAQTKRAGPGFQKGQMLLESLMKAMKRAQRLLENSQREDWPDFSCFHSTCP